MAIADNILLMSKFLANFVKIYRISVYEYCRLIYIIIPQTASFVSVWLIMITTAERTAAVVYPLKVSIMFSKKRCKILIICMIIFFFLLTSTAGFCSYHDPERPYLCMIKGGSGSFYHLYFQTIYQILKSTLGSWLPSLIGICLNITIIVYLKKASNERKNIIHRSSITNEEANTINIIKNRSNVESSSVNRQSLLNGQKKISLNNNTSKEKQITIMLLTISISFVALTMPYSFFELIRKLIDHQTLNKVLSNHQVRKLQRAMLFLIDLNHSTNFIFYVLTAERFRNELKRIFIFWAKE